MAKYEVVTPPDLVEMREELLALRRNSYGSERAAYEIAFQIFNLNVTLDFIEQHLRHLAERVK